MLSLIRTAKTSPGGRPPVSRTQRKMVKAADAARDRSAWPEAARLYRAYLNDVPNDAQIWTQFGHALKESGLLADSEAAYRTGLVFLPQDAELYLQLGHVLKLQRRFDEAQMAYRRSSALDPTLGAEAEITWHTNDAPAPPAAPAAPLGSEAVSTPPTLDDADRFNIAADEARDRGAREDAARHYRDALAIAPDRTGVWVQYGHMLRDLNQAAEAEDAYRTAIRLDPSSADAHFQLGHLLFLRSRTEEAHASFRRAVAIGANGVSGVTGGVAASMRVAGYHPAFDDIGTRIGDAPRLFVEVTDLFTVIRHYSTISGIQRVQVHLVHNLIARGVDCDIVFWKDDLLWAVQPGYWSKTMALFNAPITMAERVKVLDRMMEDASSIRPGVHDTVLVTGAFWIGPDPRAVFAKIKRTGARLGAYIYDFIPLTTPEFVPQHAVDEFGYAATALMAQMDFAFTISNFVGREVVRLRQHAGLPDVPVLTVPLAHELESSQRDGDVWVDKSEELRGREFILCVGSISAHKNHMVVFQAWRLLLQKGMEPPLLVLAGRVGYGVSDITEQLRSTFNLGGRVLVLEGLNDDAIATLYRHCLFTILPSFVEGWGLPVGESLAHGKLCLASGETAVPEVGGDFVVEIDPYSARNVANNVTALLDDRSLLKRKEDRVRSHFQPRSWAEFGRLFVAALDEIAAVPASDVVVLQPLLVLRPRSIVRHWWHGTVLPPVEVACEETLSFSMLDAGWHPIEFWGCWMDGAEASIVLPTDRRPGTQVRLVMQLQSVTWARSNNLHVVAGDGERISLAVPARGRRFVVPLDCGVGERGIVRVTLSIAGQLASTPGEARTLGLGLRKLFFLDLTSQAERMPASFPFYPTAITAASGYAVEVYGRDAMIEAARRRAILTEGWMEPEGWGVWMQGRSACLSLVLEVAALARVCLMLRLRGRAARGGVISAETAGGPASSVTIAPGAGSEAFLVVIGQVDAQSRIAISLRTIPTGLQAGLIGLAWTALGEGTEQQALTNLLLVGSPEHGGNESELVNRDTTTIVVGHLSGSYSLAAVNRRLIRALDGRMPGSVRVAQVEGNLRPRLEGLVGRDAAAFGPLTYFGRAGMGAEVAICQHWPVQPPQVPSDLPLAYVFWEESVVPPDIVNTLNQHYHGVLVPARSVGKALVDSGVRVPVRFIGFAPDLGRFLQVGADRAARSAARPFTFLHVSSCFPRKGVDVLIAAFAKSFDRTDPVRLVIKGFPNPHNEVAAQLERLRTANPDLGAIELINRDMSESEMLTLFAEADCMVLPTRGEGFNIPAIEAIAAGLALIVTGTGGHMDFADAGVARLVDYRLTHSRSHLRSANSVWAEPDLDDLAAAMRSAVDAPSTDADRAARAARAQAVGDPDAWADRVRVVVGELLGATPPPRSTVAWVSTWMIRCGIGEYSRMLLGAFPHAETDITVLCDGRTSPADLVASPIQARRVWECKNTASMDTLAAAIDEIEADVVVIQHHHALISWPDLLVLLEDNRVAARPVVVTMHNTKQIYDETSPVQSRLFTALAGIARVLVHTVADLNRLRDEGLVDNVSLVPHGALRSTLPINSPRVLTPHTENIVIGTYGFFLPSKGFDRLIEAFASIRSEYPNARLRLVTAEYPEPVSADLIVDCRALAERLNVGSAIDWHTGYLDNAESLLLLHGCDLLVMPYQQTLESSSAAVRTALAAHVPVIVSPLPIFEELNDAVLRLHSGGVEDIASGTLWVLGNPAVRAGLVRASELWLEENSWDTVSARWSGMLQGLVASISTNSV